MDTTEQRAGFRLPWSDRREAPAENGGGGAPPEGEGPSNDATEAPSETEIADPAPGGEIPMADGSDGTPEPRGPGMTASVAEAGESAQARRPSRFLAELTRAMHAAAEEGRVATLDQLRADGKTAVEEIQSRSADDATSIRRNADDDVTRIREWSKAEIARVREETEQRIAARKAGLDGELEAHAAIVEAEIENVQGQVAAFENEMESFFERLIAEGDPGRFAALAASLPEPRPFAPLSEDERARIAAQATAAAVAVEEAPVAEETVAEQGVESEAAADAGQAGAEAALGETVEGEQPEAAFAHEPGATDASAGTIEPEPAAGEATPVEATADGTTGAEATPDLADAERDALDGVSAGEGDEAAAAERSISARLAGLAAAAPAVAEAAPAADGPTETSQVIVTGLTSVSSIAAFKRQLGRLGGVRSVAVSSGPSGEFVFAVVHASGIALADSVATLGGFSPTVTRSEPGIVEVTARDPEA